MHNETGYWGPVDANHQFCEPHYASTFYLAEAWNAISSLLYVAAACHVYGRIVIATRNSTKTESKMTDRSSSNNNMKAWWMTALCLWLAVIGFGSFLYHGTMRRSMQLLDEGPMVGLLTTSALYKVDKYPWTVGYTRQYRVLLAMMHLAVYLLYAWLDKYEWFVHGFTILALIDAGLVYGQSKYLGGNFVYRDIALACILLGKALWEVENRFCEVFPAVWPLHVVWHVLSCTCAYSSLLYNSSMVQQQQHRNNDNNVYVTVETRNTKKSQ